MRKRTQKQGVWLFLAVSLLFCGFDSSCGAELRADAGRDMVVVAGDPVRFDGSLSRGNISRFRWEFGDHEYFDNAATFFESDLRALKPGAGPHPIHTYWRPGNYEVALKVFDKRGSTDTDTVVVTVKPNSPPRIKFDASRKDGGKGTVFFDPSRSEDPEGDAVSYSWSFSDGSGSKEKEVRHQYDLGRVSSEIGDCDVRYRVLLRATDSHGAESVASRWIGFDTATGAAAERPSGRRPPGRELLFSLSIREGRIHARKLPEAVDIFTGERTFFPVEVVNEDRSGHTITLAKISPKNTHARLERRPIRPGETVTLPLEIQTLSVYDHTLDLKLSAGEIPRKFSLPLRVNIRPFTPLIGGYAHFSRHAAPDVVGKPFTQSKKFAHIHVGEKRAVEDMQYMRDYPIQIYRANCQWHNVQREGPKSYEWELSDWEIEQAVKAGARVVVTFSTGPPKWVGRYDFTNDARALSAYRLFVEKMVDRYGDKVDYYELSNEPFSFWLKKFLGPKRMKAFKKNPKAARQELDKFAAVITKASKVAHEVISDKDPTALLIMPGFENKTRKTWGDPLYFSIWEILFKKGIHRYCQRVGVHNFPFWYNAELPSLNDLERWRKLDKNADSSQLLTLMRKYNVPPAIWLTEIGGFRNSDAVEVGHALAMLHTTAIIAHQYGEGILTVGLYDYPTDDSPYVYLMKYENHHKTLGFYAFKHLISTLSGAVPYESRKIKNSSIIGADYGSVVLKPFSRGSEDILCLWNNSPGTKKVTLKLAPGFAKPDIYEITETSFSARGEFYAQRMYSGFADSDKTISFTLQPLDFKTIQVITPDPEFRWLAALDY